MSPSQFTEALGVLGWSQRHLAVLLRCDTNLPTRWSRGTAAIPEVIADWLEALVYAHRYHGVPDNWRRATHRVASRIGQ